MYTAVLVGVAGTIFAITRQFAGPAPRTMTKEWQEATNSYLKVIYAITLNAVNILTNKQEEGMNPIYGISSEGYSGKGYVQSKPAKSQGITIEPDE